MKSDDNKTAYLASEYDLSQALRLSEERLDTIIEFSSIFYWETDTNHRLTYYWSRQGNSDRDHDPRNLLGKANWDLGETSESDQELWRKHLAVREAREPFSGFQHKYIHPEWGLRHVTLSGKPVFDSQGNFTGYCGIAWDITEMVEGEQMLQLEASVLRVISGKNDISDGIRSAMQIICESQGWEAGSFWELDEQANVLRYKAGWSSQENPAVARIMERAGDVVFERGSGLPGWVWQRGESLWIPDIMNDSRVWTKEVTELTGWNAAFLFPVTLEEKFLGAMDFYAPSIPEPTGRLLQVIRVLGTEIGHYYQRALAMEELRVSEARFRNLIELSSEWYWELDSSFRFTRFDGRDKTMVKALKGQFIGRNVWDTEIKIIGDGEKEIDSMERMMKSHESFRDVITYRALPDGSERYMSISGEPFYNDKGVFLGYRGLSRDVTSNKQAEEKIRYLATHDPLTGMPNRTMFSQLLNHSIETARRYERRFAVFFIDLDRFKFINDTLGHHAGDKVLIDMAERLKARLRESDIIARLGGDEFVVLAQEVNEPNQVARIARNILSTVLKPISIQGQECRVTASVGISLYPENARDEHSLMKQADAAMYLAKEAGKNNYQFYSTEITSDATERLMLEANLRRALQSNEFYLHYQAKLDSKSGRIKGVEALLRWDDPELGSLPPSRFIPVAEEMGLMIPIGKWVIKTACEQNVAWQKQGLPPVCIAVNLSLRQFTDPRLSTDIEEILAQTGLDAGLLEFEVTEGMIMHDTERAVEVLTALKKLGVRLSIDDFGTGYTSLAKLGGFPIDTLKVDRSFINDLSSGNEGQSITKAIIAMGSSLGLTIIAEGVETREQQIFLESHACDEMQGFYFSKPVSSKAFEDLLRDQSPQDNGDG